MSPNRPIFNAFFFFKEIFFRLIFKKFIDKRFLLAIFSPLIRYDVLFTLNLDNPRIFDTVNLEF